MTKVLTGAGIDYLRERFKGLFDLNDREVSVGTATVEVAPASAERVSLSFCNLSDTGILLRPKVGATLTAGLFLSPGGGIITINVEQDGLLPLMNWYGICSVAGKAVYVLESFRYARSEEGA